MKIIKDTVIFECSPEFYEKESMGIKNNTCRTLESILTDGYTIEDLVSSKYIIIRNTETERQIERELSDVSVFEGIVIISWYGM